MKGEKIILLGGLIALFLISFPMKSDAAEVPGVTKDSILIGGLAPLTGPNTGDGVACRDGGQTYFDIINEAGGILGRKLRITWEDDGCVPAKGVAAVKKLVERDKVFALYGGVCSNALIAALPQMEKANIPWLTAIVSGPPVTKPAKPCIFRAGSLPTDAQARLLAKAAVDYFHAERIGILHMSDEFGNYYRDNFKKYFDENKILPVAVETFNPGDVDYTSQLARLKDAKPDVVLMVMWSPDAAVMIKQSKKIEFNPLWICAPPTGTGSFIDLAGDAAIGTIHYWHFKYLLTDTHQPAMVKFREEFKKRIGEKPGRPNASDLLSYNGAVILVEALKGAGKDLTREKLVKSFESMKNFDTALATPINFSVTEHQGNLGANFMVILPNLRRALLDIRIKPY